MEHKLKVHISKKPQPNAVVSCRSKSVREKMLRFLFGEKRQVTILVPGDKVEELEICDAQEGEKTND